MNSILYIAAILCFSIFFMMGNLLMEIDTILRSTKQFYEYIGYMSIGLGIFSSSVLVFLAKSERIE